MTVLIIVARRGGRFYSLLWSCYGQNTWCPAFMEHTRYKHSRSARWEISLPYWEPAACQDESKTRLNQFASEGKWMNDLPVPKAVCLSLLGLLAASSPLSGFTGPFPFAAFPSRCLVAEHQRQTPPRACTGFYTAMGGQVPRTVWKHETACTKFPQYTSQWEMHA